MDQSCSAERCPKHVAAFFKTEDFLWSRVAWFVAEGVATNEEVIERRLLWLDADDLLAALTVDGAVSVGAFRANLQRFIDPAIPQQDIRQQHTHVVSDSGEHITLH